MLVDYSMSTCTIVLISEEGTVCVPDTQHYYIGKFAVDDFLEYKVEGDLSTPGIKWIFKQVTS